MNLNNSSFEYVEPPSRPFTRHVSFRRPRPTSDRHDSPVLGYGGLDDISEHPSLEGASISPPPPATIRLLSPFSTTSSHYSSDDLNGIDRHYGRSLLPRAFFLAMANPSGESLQSSQRPHYTPQQLQAIVEEERRRMNPPMPMAARPIEEFRDPLALEAARVTPGVDDTPYIQYAIEQLTRERENESSLGSSTSSGGPMFPTGVNRGYYGHGNAPIAQQPPPAAQSQDAPRQSLEQRAPLLSESSRRQSSPRSSLTLVKVRDRAAKFPTRQPHPDAWDPVDPGFFNDGREKINPRLVFKPMILRTTTMTILMTLLSLITALLIFSAVYSQKRNGLWDYAGTIYSGQYFLFRVFPAMVGAVILIWSQCTLATFLRVRPFARLAASDRAARADAIFDDLYPTSFLRPHLVGTWRVWVPNLITWVMNITLPLLSCLFTPIYVNGHWRWATVEGVAWTLVGLYFLLVATIGLEASCWLVEKTGLMWDPRSIADVAAIISHSNTLEDYKGTEMLGSRDQMRRVLYRRRHDMLSYWCWADRDRLDDLWYTIGRAEDWSDPTAEAEVFDEKVRPKSYESRPRPKSTEDVNPWGDVELEGDARHPAVRYRHLPFCLKSLPLITFIITGLFLLVALFLVCFLPQTSLVDNGFLPRVSAAPTQGDFSAADFLYSFIPALLGMVLFAAFRDLDLHLRILQPWGELSSPPPGGARPEASLLADYAACHPFQAPLHAARNGHWRVAAISLLSTLFILIPIFAGGMFIALTPEDDVVRVFPQVPLFALTLTLLVLYWLALVSLFPGRNALRLPHGVTCLAEIISFVANEDCVRDEAFSGMIRNKTSLVGKLGCDRREAMIPRWTLMPGGTGALDARLGIRRVKTFTTRAMVVGRDPTTVRLMDSPEAAPRPMSVSVPLSLGTRTISDSRRAARRESRGSVGIASPYGYAAREY